MKTIKTTIIVAATCITLGASSALAAGFGARSFSNQPHGSWSSASAISQPAYSELNQQDEEGLLKMREEEKLARDVYIYLYDMWQNEVFSNISESEQRHMDSIRSLLDKYGLADPVEGMEPGQFYSPEMQELYDTLIAQGATSLEDALIVGATIEDLDIKDLEELIEATDNEDIQEVYQNLMKGSRNHLRAFGSQLADMGITYEAQFLTQEEVDAIINSDWERGRVDKDGNQISGPGTNGNRGRGRSLATWIFF